MNVIIKSFFCLSIVVSAATQLSAKSWRGIEPLHSTRADVLRLFNQCSQQKEACEFRAANEGVYILFSGALITDYPACEKRLPPETVIFIEVVPDPSPKAGELHLDKRKFKTFNPSAPSKLGYLGYSDLSEGLIVKTHKGRVVQLDYIASASDQELCPGYYAEPESFVQVFMEATVVSVNCEKSSIAGEKLTCSADSDAFTRRGFQWTVTAGRIISGQASRRITVDTVGLAGQSITVTVQVTEGSRAPVSSSFVVQVSAGRQ
jgi:hypothetical protein